MRRPVIGIPCDVKFVGRADFHAVGEKYIAAVQGAVGDLVLLPAWGDMNILKRLLPGLDGIFLTGSLANVKPSRYGSDLADPDTLLDEKPEYPGGMKELVKFIQQSILYPPVALQKKTQGRVWIEGIIDTDGKIIQPKVVYGADSLLDKEALRVIKMMPKWKPGKQRGKPVRVKYTVPVTFKLQ